MYLSTVHGKKKYSSLVLGTQVIYIYIYREVFYVYLSKHIASHAITAVINKLVKKAPAKK